MIPSLGTVQFDIAHGAENLLFLSESDQLAAAPSTQQVWYDSSCQSPAELLCDVTSFPFSLFYF